MNTRLIHGKKMRIILPITTGNKSGDSNLSSDEDVIFSVRSLTNGSSSEEEHEDLSGTENGVSSDEAVKEDKSRKKETIKYKKQNIKWEACQRPDALNMPLTKIPNCRSNCIFAALLLMKFYNIFAMKAANILYELILINRCCQQKSSLNNS